MARGLWPAVVLLVVTGCGGGTSEPHRAPRNFADCARMFSMGDAESGAGLDWSTEKHRYNVTATFYACYYAGPGATVSIQTPQGVDTVPARARVGPSHVIPFTVTVDRGARGVLSVTFIDPSGRRFGQAIGPKIVLSADGWRFASGSG